MTETVPVKVCLVGQERLAGHGALAALLNVELEFACGFVLPIHGIQIMRPRNGSKDWEIRSPHYRGSAGQWRPAVDLPDVVLRAIIEQLTEEKMRDLPSFVLGIGAASGSSKADGRAT